MVTMMMVVFAAMLLMVAPVQAASKTKTTKVTMKAGQSKTLRVKTAGKVKWSSSNKAIVSVNKKGKIVARRAGKAKITAKYGKKKAVFVVTVKSTPCVASSIRIGLTVQSGVLMVLRLRPVIITIAGARYGNCHLRAHF